MSDKTGISCGNCGATDLDVIRTAPARGHITRRRLCRVCGARLTTVERPVGAIIPAPVISDGLAQVCIGQLAETVDMLRFLSSHASANSNNQDRSNES